MTGGGSERGSAATPTFNQRISLERVRQWLERQDGSPLHPDDVREVYNLAALSIARQEEEYAEWSKRRKRDLEHVIAVAKQQLAALSQGEA